MTLNQGQIHIKRKCSCRYQSIASFQEYECHISEHVMQIRMLRVFNVLLESMKCAALYIMTYVE